MKTAGKHYQTLSVRADATQAEIKAAYRTLARQHHPDVVTVTDGGLRMQEINEAYRVLGDVDARRRYDESGDSRAEDAVAEQARNVLLQMFAEALQAGSETPLSHVRKRLALKDAELAQQPRGVKDAVVRVREKLAVVTTVDGVFNAYNHLITLELERAESILVDIERARVEVKAAQELLKSYRSTEVEPQPWRGTAAGFHQDVSYNKFFNQQ